jgi:hypothetical protein
MNEKIKYKKGLILIGDTIYTVYTNYLVSDKEFKTGRDMGLFQKTLTNIELVPTDDSKDSLNFTVNGFRELRALFKAKDTQIVKLGKRFIDRSEIRLLRNLINSKGGELIE